MVMAQGQRQRRTRGTRSGRKPVGIYLLPEVSDQVDALVRSGRFANRSHAIEQMIQWRMAESDFRRIILEDMEAAGQDGRLPSLSGAVPIG